MRKRILSFTLVIFSFILLLNIGLHLPYPLLWNDESATAMMAKSVIRFGYPRILYDGNLITQLPRIALENLSDSKLASKENGWLTYYFAAPFVFLAEKTDDIYLKTAIIRTPFVTLGLMSIFFFAYIGNLFLSSSKMKYLVFLLFLFYAVLNVPLLLHIREARYYSVLLLLVSIYFYILFRYFIFSTLSYRYICFTLPIICLSIVLTYPPAVFPCLVTLAVSSCCYKGRFHLPTMPSLLPFFATCIAIVPFLLFFEVFSLAEQASKVYQITFQKMGTNIVRIISSLYWDDLILLFFTTLGSTLLLSLFLKNNRKIINYISASILVCVFFLSSVAIFSRLPFVFTRYFIFFGPLVSLMAITGIILIKETTVPLKLDGWKKGMLLLLTLLMIYNLAIHNGRVKGERITNHIYELTHQYQGPLDVVIPYLLTHATDPKNLIIATNYEEFSYMYYLQSKVIVGYVGINLKEDLTMRPDVIIYRPGWGTDPNIFRYFLSKDTYEEVTFPIFNYPLNNIPEFYFDYPHQFRTLYAKEEKEKVRIFVRKGILQS